MRKLIRDNIPEIIRREGKISLTGPAMAWELPQLVRAKLQEELDEVLSATTKEHVTEELADLVEIARKYARINGIDWNDVEEARLEKKATKGGFEANYVLEKA